MMEHVAELWLREWVNDRLERCRITLYLHDMLTEAENERVKRKIAERVAFEEQERRTPTEED